MPCVKQTFEKSLTISLVSCMLYSNQVECVMHMLEVSRWGELKLFVLFCCAGLFVVRHRAASLRLAPLVSCVKVFLPALLLWLPGLKRPGFFFASPLLAL